MKSAAYLLSWSMATSTRSSKQAVRDAVMEYSCAGPIRHAISLGLPTATFLDSGGIGVLLSAVAHLPPGGWLGLFGTWCHGPGP